MTESESGTALQATCCCEDHLAIKHSSCGARRSQQAPSALSTLQCCHEAQTLGITVITTLCKP